MEIHYIRNLVVYTLRQPDKCGLGPVLFRIFISISTAKQGTEWNPSAVGYPRPNVGTSRFEDVFKAWQLSTIFG